MARVTCDYVTLKMSGLNCFNISLVKHLSGDKLIGHLSVTGNALSGTNYSEKPGLQPLFKTVLYFSRTLVFVSKYKTFNNNSSCSSSNVRFSFNMSVN